MTKQKEPKKKSGKAKAAHLQKHAFKPGQSGNPNGRPKTPPDLLAARNHSREELERAVLRLVWADEDAVAAEIMDTSLPLIQRAIARVTLRAFVTGDIKSLAFLLDRAGFPVKKDDRPSTPALLAALPLDQLLALAGKAFNVLREGDQMENGPTINVSPEIPDDDEEEIE